MNDYAAGSKLGVKSDYVHAYDPELLFPIARSDYRKTLEGSHREAAFGCDLWHSYEISWLDLHGKPVSRCGRLCVPADSPNIVESKSFKLYLNSLNQQVFTSEREAVAAINRDLSKKLGVEVQMALFAVDDNMPSYEATAIHLDELEVNCSHYQRDQSLLAVSDRMVKNEVLQSHLLRSNCPVTQQPDWASLTICYSGRQLDHAQLLKYIVSYRQHNGFHEQCVEQIYTDLIGLGTMDELSVFAQYTRRGGLDINPYRSSRPEVPALGRSKRQ